jgi:hypothetical protein
MIRDIYFALAFATIVFLVFIWLCFLVQVGLDILTLI